MKKKTILLIIVLVVAVTAAFLYFRSGKKVQPATVITARPQYGYIAKSVTATGNVEPDDTVSVGAQVSGVVKNVYADFNSVVRQGQLIAKVDPSIMMAQVDEAKASLANAQSNLEYQKSTFERQSSLYDLGAISKADYQVALNQYNSAKAAGDNARAQLTSAEKTLSYTDIYSPISGVVLNRNISAGQTIASSFNAPVLFVIAKDLTKMQVNADVDEADIGGVKTGQYVTFTVDAFPNDIFNGTVEDIYLHPSVSANVVTYTTLINVDNKEMKLKPGMTASINIYIAEDSNVLLIPSRALAFKPDSASLSHYKIVRAMRDTAGMGKHDEGRNFHQLNITNKKSKENDEIQRSYVWVKSGDTLIERIILTGLNDDSYVKVIKGLSTDDDVVTNIGTGANKTAAGIAQQSPFMPRMGRRPTR
jgi:HlyD family secretion protein